MIGGTHGYSESHRGTSYKFHAKVAGESIAFGRTIVPRVLEYMKSNRHTFVGAIDVRKGSGRKADMLVFDMAPSLDERSPCSRW